MKPSALFLAVVALPLVAGAQATRSLCDTAVRTPDLLACARQERDSASLRLLRIVGRVVEALPGAARAAFLRGDDTWQRYQRLECEAVLAGYEAGREGGIAQHLCEAQLADVRARALTDAFHLEAVRVEERGGCSEYEPTQVTIAGRLERRTYPGRPNFKSVRRGDEPETGLYLVVPPLCVTRNVDATNVPTSGVRLVQLVLDPAGAARLRPMLGRQISLTGALFHASTGHHHAELLLRVVP